MDQEVFRQYCTKQNIPQDEMERSIKELEKFEDFLRQHKNEKPLEKITLADVQLYIDFLKDNRAGDYYNFIALARFAQSIKSNAIYVSVVELLDGADVMERLFNSIAFLTSETLRDIIFDELELPVLGTGPYEKANFTHKVLDRMDLYLDVATCKKVLQNYLHYIPKEQFAEDHENYLKTGDIDTFLEEKHKKFIAQLEKCKNEKTLFFTQEITDPVIDYVHKLPTTEGGVREGNTIIVTKIPYNAKEFLREKDSNRKKYYYCHCPWVRESLNDQKVSISIPPIFCNCSAGFYKQYWEAVLGQPVEVEVVETVLQDKDICKFAVHLPANIAKKQ